MIHTLYLALPKDELEKNVTFTITNKGYVIKKHIAAFWFILFENFVWFFGLLKVIDKTWEYGVQIHETGKLSEFDYIYQFLC